LVRRDPVRWSKPGGNIEENGYEQMFRQRCKRRWYVWKVGESDQGEPNSFPCGIRDSIRWKAESLTEAGKEVGDAHSSDLQDERDNITLSEQRGVSLKMTVKKTR
jgi:hypothetical protein